MWMTHLKLNKIYKLKYIALKYRRPFHDVGVVGEVCHKLSSLRISFKICADKVSDSSDFQNRPVKVPIRFLIKNKNINN